MSWGEFLLNHLWSLIALAVLLVFSGFFSGTETSLFNLTRAQLHRLTQSRNRLSRLPARLLSRPDRLLNTLLLGNMIVNVAYAGNSALLVMDLHGRGANAVEVMGFTLVTLLGLILFGEVIPKMLAYRIGEPWAVTCSAPVALIGRVLTPALWVMETLLVQPLTKLIAPRAEGADISSEELATLLDVSAKRGLVDRDAGSMLQSIVELTHLKVGDIMVPRVDMVAYDVNDDPAGLAKLFRTTGLRKIPVYDGDLDHVVGTVHAKRQLLQPTAPLARLVSDVIYVPEAADLEKLLLQFRVRRRQSAIVVDEYGGTAGLVTLEDALEEIVGDIPDTEGDQARSPVRRISETEYLLDGMVPIHEWVDAFHMDLSVERHRTVGGFIASLLGRMPRVGDEADYRNLHFTVVSMRGRRVGTLRVQLVQREQPPAEEVQA
ncbi:MAG: hemolysin family protein [Phycisphaerae bacterium]